MTEGANDLIAVFMKIIKICCLFISLLGLITSCSGGSGSGGGSSSNGGTGDGGTVPLTYTETDLGGTWRWNADLSAVPAQADRQTVPLTLTGTMIFNNNVRVIGMETDRCPGQQDISTAQFWLWPDGYVKGNIQAFCNYPGSEMKFSMDFVPGSNKKTISGLMDIHQVDSETGIDSYVRFDITMIKQ